MPLVKVVEGSAFPGELWLGLDSTAFIPAFLIPPEIHHHPGLGSSQLWSLGKKESKSIRNKVKLYLVVLFLGRD